MTVKVFRFIIPADRDFHRIIGNIVHVGSRDEDAVEVWAEVTPECEAAYRDDPKQVQEETVALTVFSTGDEIPDGLAHVGSTITRSALNVWHVYRRPNGG